MWFDDVFMIKFNDFMNDYVDIKFMLIMFKYGEFWITRI